MGQAVKAGAFRATAQRLGLGGLAQVRLNASSRQGVPTVPAVHRWNVSQPEPALASEAPFDATVVAHGASDVLADALFEHRLPGNELEAHAVDKQFR